MIRPNGVERRNRNRSCVVADQAASSECLSVSRCCFSRNDCGRERPCRVGRNVDAVEHTLCSSAQCKCGWCGVGCRRFGYYVDDAGEQRAAVDSGVAEGIEIRIVAAYLAVSAGVGAVISTADRAVVASVGVVVVAADRAVVAGVGVVAIAADRAVSAGVGAVAITAN